MCSALEVNVFQQDAMMSSLGGVTQEVCVGDVCVFVWLQDGHQDTEDSVEDESMSGVCNVSARLLLHAAVTWHWREAPGCVSLSLCFGFNPRWWCHLCCVGTVMAPPAGSLLLWNWHVVASRSWFVSLLILRPGVVCCEGKPSSLCGRITLLLPFAHFLCPSFSLRRTKIRVKSSDGVDLSASGNVRFRFV